MSNHETTEAALASAHQTNRELRATIDKLNDENLRLYSFLGECKGTIDFEPEHSVIALILKKALNQSSSPYAAALLDVIARRVAQNKKWGVQNHDPITWSAILTEECGEFAQAALELKFGGPNAQGLRDEAIDCAAVALQIVECIDRNTPPAASAELKAA